MTLDFACPECDRRLRVPSESAGKHCKCPGCQVVVPIPKSNSKKAIDQRRPINSQQVNVSNLPPDRIQVACPKCAHLLECDAKLQGTRGLCKNCNAVFTISSDPEEREISIASFVFACPFCKKLFDGKPELAGRRAKCDACQSVFQIEQVNAAQQPAAATTSSPTPSHKPSSNVVKHQVIASSSKLRQTETTNATEPIGRPAHEDRAPQQSVQKPTPQASKPETTFAIECPTCAKHLEVNSKLVGKTIACPGCRTQMVVPSVEEDDVADLGAFAQENFTLDQYSQPSDPLSASLFSSHSANPFADAMPQAVGNSYAMPSSMGSTPMMNPYAAPNAVGNGAMVDGSTEAIRRKHLSHEASIKSFGFLFFIGAVLGSLASFVYLLMGVGALAEGGPAVVLGVVLLVLGIVVLSISILQGFAAFGLRKLTTFGRIGGTVIGAIGLLAFPLGTIVSGYLLYLLWSEKGNVVFSPQYQRVMQATPHIKYKTSIIVWIFLGLLGFVVLLGIVGLIAAGASRSR